MVGPVLERVILTQPGFGWWQPLIPSTYFTPNKFHAWLFCFLRILMSSASLSEEALKRACGVFGSQRSGQGRGADIRSLHEGYLVFYSENLRPAPELPQGPSTGWKPPVWRKIDIPNPLHLSFLNLFMPPYARSTINSITSELAPCRKIQSTFGRVLK